jgi:DNA adenine methylase
MLYVEPFVGSGAMLFHKQPDHAIISDLNPGLVNVYRMVKNRMPEFMKYLSEFSTNDSAELYDAIKSRFNAQKADPNAASTPLQAARFVYLIARCFNGLYRENDAGNFNVSYAKDLKGTKVIADEKNFTAIHRYLKEKDVDVYNVDYSDVLAVSKAKSEKLGSRCFFFLDPVYYPLRANGFTKYNKGGWNDSEFDRLASFVKEIDDRGDKFMLCNHDVNRIRQLFKAYNIESHAVPRCISCDTRHRMPVKEVVVMNYRNSSLLDYLTKGSNVPGAIDG